MRFVVIASARTGSNHLVTELGRERDIWCHGEIFHREQPYVRWPGWPGSKAPKGLRAELRSLRAEDPERFLARIYSLGFGRLHIGFKIFEMQDPTILDKLIVEREIAKIVLIRTNVLANYASRLVAQKAGNWGVRNAKRRADIAPVRFDPDKFLAFHDRYMGFYARTLHRLDGCGQAYRFVRYDELNNSLLLANLVRFLGATPAAGEPLAAETARGSSDILSRFANPQEVLGFLRSIGHLDWAHERDIDFSPLPQPQPVPDSDLGTQTARCSAR